MHTSTPFDVEPDRKYLGTLLLRWVLRSLGKTTLSWELWLAAALLLSLALCLQTRGVLWKLLDVGKELGLAGNVLPQYLRHLNAVFALVVLKDAAESTLCGTEGGVEGVNVGFLE